MRSSTTRFSIRGHFHRAILGDAATPKIDAIVRLDGFVQESTPYKALYGTMTVPDLADLYGEHKRGLFARNIRDSLDLTDVNVKIQNTLLEQPEHFWYFSNGITMLCETIKPVGRAVPGKVGDFKLTGISVVNGAQTVSALHRAFVKDPDTAQIGRVTVRLISLEDCPEGFGDQVTTTTNTQNPIEERDFKSLDQGQIQLRDDFALLLHRSYVIKRGERVPDPQHGCSMTEAAEALAAVHPNAQLAAVAKRDQNLAGLWEDRATRTFGSTRTCSGSGAGSSCSVRSARSSRRSAKGWSGAPTPRPCTATCSSPTSSSAAWIPRPSRARTSTGRGNSPRFPTWCRTPFLGTSRDRQRVRHVQPHHRRRPEHRTDRASGTCGPAQARLRGEEPRRSTRTTK